MKLWILTSAVQRSSIRLSWRWEGQHFVSHNNRVIKDVIIGLHGVSQLKHEVNWTYSVALVISWLYQFATLNIQVLTMITILVYPVANRLTKLACTFLLCKVHVMLATFGLEEIDCQNEKRNTIIILGFLTYWLWVWSK